MCLVLRATVSCCTKRSRNFHCSVRTRIGKRWHVVVKKTREKHGCYFILGLMGKGKSNLQLWFWHVYLTTMMSHHYWTHECPQVFQTPSCLYLSRKGLKRPWGDSPLDILSAFISGWKRSNSPLSVVHMFLNSVPLFLSCAIDQVEMKGRPGSSFNEEINSSCE